MRIVFKNIKLHNFMSYEDADLNLNRNGYVFVNGINNNPVDNAKSNGTGKSSLFSAISWALTGLTVSGSKEVSNINTDGKTRVELEFTVDNNDYKVIRFKNPSNLKLYVNGEDKSGKGIRDTEVILGDYLPDITHSLLNSVIILGQGLPQKFTSNSPSGRKDVLEKLSNSDFMITDLKNRLTNRKTYLSNKLREYEDFNVDLNARAGMTRNMITEQQLELSNMSDANLSTFKNTLTDLTITMNNEIEIVDDIKENLNKLLSEQESINIELNNKNEEYNIKKGSLKLSDTSKLESEINELKAQVLSNKKEITKLDSMTDVCPTCGQKLPDVTLIDTSELKNKTEALETFIHNKCIELDEINDANNKLITGCEKEYQDSIRAINNKFTQLSSEINCLTTQISEKESHINSYKIEIANLQNNINSFNEKKDSLQKTIDKNLEDVRQFEEEILYNNNEIKNYNNKLDINTKMMTVVKRDFRGYLLTNVIEFISTRAKLYSMDLFETDKLDFILDGNNISIMYDNKDYDVLSGGEQQKVDVIIQLAIRDMLCKFLNFSSNILVLDEITDSLDITGSQKMFNLISTKLNDVESVYIISHHSDFELPVDSEITIVKGSDKISRIIN